MNTSVATRTTLLLLFLLAGFEEATAEPDLISFSDDEEIADRRPIIIAHRGGVVTPRSHECSLTAIRLAAEMGYDMVELDVQQSSDGVPIVFHDRSLTKACGKRGRVADFTASELESIPYLTGNDRIIRLQSALRSCRRLGLGVMLDLKSGQDSPEFLVEVDQLLDEHGLGDSTISISGSATARRILRHVRFTITDDDMRRLRKGDTLDLSHSFWFGIPMRLQPGDVDRLKSAGALIIPAINTFRYPSDRHFRFAKVDIRRLTDEAVDGFQIDSVYFSLFDQNRVKEKLAK